MNKDLFPFGKCVLQVGTCLLSSGGFVQMSSGDPATVQTDEDYAAVLRPLLTHVSAALREALPRTGHNLALTGNIMPWAVVESATPVAGHAIEMAMNFIFAVRDDAPEEKRHRYLTVFVAYCVAALATRHLVGFAVRDEGPWLALWFLAHRVVKAGFITRQAQMRHESLMAAAQQVEARLPLEVRLGLDIMPDGNPLLPSQRVRRPGAASMLSPIPWPALFGATIPSVSAFDAATRLSADNLHVESDVSGKYRACARVNNQWSNQWLELQALSDLPQLVQTLDTAIGESEYKATTLTPPDEEKGCFRATSHRVNSPGRFRHVLRPIVFEPASLTDRS